MTNVNVSPSGMSQSTADGLYQAQESVQTASPTTGTTVTMTDNSTDGTLYLTPAGALAALTVAFPSNANSRVGQVRRIATTQAIATLTLSGPSSILNAISALNSGDCYAFQKVSSNTWVRLA